MVGETVQFDKAAEGAAKREQSSILFPYLDLDVGVDVAQHMHKTRGYSSMESHELAAQMNQTISGAFRLKTGTARIFGLTEKDGRDGTKLSELGRLIIEPETEKSARAEAFMRVPLYAAIYEKYKGQRLPPMKALEREMVALGVSSKQADKARQAFERSARQAGYFELGEDRLVRPRTDVPSNDASQRKPDAAADEQGNQNPGGGGGGGGDLHPFIRGLLDTLPEPGSSWSSADRKIWLGTAESIFKLIYKDDSARQPDAYSSSSETAADQ
jgi:hypothetical protein